jgi:heme o synthase
VLVYTIWLKRTSRHNIVIGGAAGAAPVLVGWAAVTGSLGWTPVVLFTAMFLWTPPHFWALAIRYADDYRAADVPMLPAIAPPAEAARQMLGYTAALVVATLVLVPVAGLGWIYTAAAVLLGLGFLGATVALARRPTPRMSMKVFTYSITYVTLLFAALMIDVLVLA